MKFQIKHKLIVILTCGLLLTFLAQLITRQYFEVPALMDLETQTDKKDIERVRLAILSIETSMINNCIDHAAWDTTYEFVNLPVDDPDYENYLTTTMDPSTYEALDLDGGVIIDRDGRIIMNIHRAVINELYGADVKFLPRRLKVELLVSKNEPFDDVLISSGLTNSNLGPVMYAASHIVPSIPPYPSSRGTLIFWHLLDDRLFNYISKNLQIKIDSFSITDAIEDAKLVDIIKRLKSNRGLNLPRDKNGFLYWILDDIHNQPMFLIRQSTNKRAFSTNLLSISVMADFVMSALILFIVVIFFSRTVLSRLLYAKDMMSQIIMTGDYSRRLQSFNRDEMDTVFTQFNQLLEYIQKQNHLLVEQNLELSELSEQDPLTGISNRRYLDDVLDRSWRQCARSGKMIAVMMIDVDYFKLFNDNYGHPAGDQVLRQIAQNLQHNLHRGTEYLARYGGEEFCVVLTDTTCEAAQGVAERLRAEIQELCILSDVSICADVVTVSIGIAATIANPKVVELNLIKVADEALYEAKKQGRNRVYLKSI